jgi:apolipoprotein N-acyltransferase
MRGIPWRLLAAGTLTAVLLDLPFPLAGPLPVWRTVIAWFALVPLLLGLIRLPLDAPGRRTRWYLGWSFLSGWLSGALWFGANCYWVYGTMHTYAGMSAALAVVSLVLFSLFLGFWFGVFGLALGMVRLATLRKRYAWLALAAVPFLWTAMEFALARVPYFPWDLLGYSQVDNGLLTRLAPWTGVYGISFVVAAVNALGTGARLWKRPAIGRRQPILTGAELVYVVGLLALLVQSAGFTARPPVPSTVATAVLVQPNLDVANDDVWVGPEWDRQIAQFERLGKQTCRGYIKGIPETGAPTESNIDCNVEATPSLIVWPESPAPFRDVDPRFQTAMAEIVKADKAPMIVGAVGMDVDQAAQTYHIYNSASVVATDGRLVGRYDKMHLVPFGEYIPYRHLLFFAKQVTQTLADMNMGSERKVFRIASAQDGGHRYGVFICYESVFGDEIRQFVRLGAEVLVNISDDGWYGDTSAPWQHLNMARMRAIENRRWILRDTNNGTTASIDPYGTVRQSIPRHAVGALAAGFGYNSEVTFYTAHGDWLPAFCAILALALVVWAGRTLLWSSSPERSAAQATRL